MAAMHGGTISERLTFGERHGLRRRAPRPLHRDHPAAAFFGRLFLAAIFFVAGAMKLVHTDTTVAYMTGAGIPYADSLVWVAALAELAGAVSLALGLLTRTGAMGLILFMIPTTILFHDFWNLDGLEMTTQLVNFAKNVTIIGGLLMVAAHGPGRWSLAFQLDPDRRRGVP